MPGKTFTAVHRHARLSPYKARPVIDLVRGKNVDEALSILEWQPRRAAPMIRKVIQSALANASNDLEVKLARLVVARAVVDGGPLLGGRPRFVPRAMGRAFPIRKRTCHITVILEEGPEPKARRKKGAAKAGGGKAQEGQPPEAKRAPESKRPPEGKKE
jgi:large subunit ribosomal protein L22